jgi:N4-gp56 family major capsid protein
MAFPTGLTTTSVLSTGIQPLYDADFKIAYKKSQVWTQSGLINWRKNLGPDESRGSAVTWDVYNNLAPATTALTENDDPNPVSLSLGTVTVTPAEYGNVVQTTRVLQVQTYDDVLQAASQLVGQNQAETLDKLVRAVAVGGTWVYRPNNNTARTGLDTTNDKISFGLLTQLAAVARNQQVPSLDNESYATIANPGIMVDLVGDTTFLDVSKYSDRENIYNGEVGKMAGIKFILHRYGKIYYGGGTVAQAATTVNGAHAAGATTLTVADATGIAAGEYLTVGTLEGATSERVQVTSIAGAPALTIRGIGNTPTNFGLAFAHSNGEAVTEAPNVLALPIIGKGSMYGVSSGVFGGRDGRNGTSWKDTNIPGRFMNTWWHWYGGFQIYQKHVIRLEVATTFDTLDIAV